MAKLAEIASARSSDKGDICTMGVLAIEPEYYEVIKEQVTAERVAEQFADTVEGDVERYEMPNIDAFNFLLHDALGGGGVRSLRSDNLGKAISSRFLYMDVDVEIE